MRRPYIRLVALPRRSLLLLAVVCGSAALWLPAAGGSAGPAAKRFEPCRPGQGGGGYHVRIVGISCADARRALPRMLGEDEPVVVRRGEFVYVNDAGWTCHVQGIRAPQASQVTCIRGRQLIIYRVA